MGCGRLQASSVCSLSANLQTKCTLPAAVRRNENLAQQVQQVDRLQQHNTQLQQQVAALRQHLNGEVIRHQQQALVAGQHGRGHAEMQLRHLDAQQQVREGPSERTKSWQGPISITSEGVEAAFQNSQPTSVPRGPQRTGQTRPEQQASLCAGQAASRRPRVGIVLQYLTNNQ